MNNKVINVVLVVLIALLVNVNVYAKDSILEHEIRVENIIIIDLFRIREVEEFLVGIDPILEENGFKFKTNEIEGVDFSTNDPEPLRSQRFVPNGTHGGVRGRGNYKTSPPTRFNIVNYCKTKKSY